MLLVWSCHVCDLSQEVTCRISLLVLSRRISKCFVFQSALDSQYQLEMISLYLPPQPSNTHALPSSGWVPVMFLLLCLSAFHHCDKIPDEDKLKERKLIMAHGFQIQSMDNQPYCYSPELRRGNSEGAAHLMGGRRKRRCGDKLQPSV